MAGQQPNLIAHQRADWTSAGDQVNGARAQLAAAQSGVADAIADAGIRARQPGAGGKATVDPAADRALTAATTDLAAAKETSRQTPSHLPLGQVRPGSRLLETESKLLTHAIRMSAYNIKGHQATLGVSLSHSGTCAR